jgi:rod shape-determining protein MreD
VIRSIVLSTALLIGCSFAQAAWLGGIAILGVVPDISIVVLIWISYVNGPVAGPFTGFFAGIVEDLTSAAPLGFHAFVKTVVAALAALLHGSFFIDRFLLPIMLGALGTIVKALTAGVLALLFGGKIHSYSFVDRMLWIEVAYNGLIAPLVFFLLSPLKRALATERGRQ